MVIYIYTYIFYMWQIWIVHIYIYTYACTCECTHAVRVSRRSVMRATGQCFQWSAEESVCTPVVALPTCLVSEAPLQTCRTMWVVACVAVSALDWLLTLGRLYLAPSEFSLRFSSGFAMLVVTIPKVFLHMLLPLLWVQLSDKFSMSVGCLISVIWKTTDHYKISGKFYSQ